MKREAERRETVSADPLHLGVASTLIRSRNKRIRTSNKPLPRGQHPLPLHGRSHRTVSHTSYQPATLGPVRSYPLTEPPTSLVGEMLIL